MSHQSDWIYCKQPIKFLVVKVNVTLHMKTRLVKHGNLGETGFPKGFKLLKPGFQRVSKEFPNGFQRVSKEFQRVSKAFPKGFKLLKPGF